MTAENLIHSSALCQSWVRLEMNAPTILLSERSLHSQQYHLYFTTLNPGSPMMWQNAWPSGKFALCGRGDRWSCCQVGAESGCFALSFPQGDGSYLDATGPSVAVAHRRRAHHPQIVPIATGRPVTKLSGMGRRKKPSMSRRESQ